jgi:hypothetical protein
MPPAFVLSQDQTLRFGLSPRPCGHQLPDKRLKHSRLHTRVLEWLARRRTHTDAGPLRNRRLRRPTPGAASRPPSHSRGLGPLFTCQRSAPAPTLWTAPHISTAGAGRKPPRQDFRRKSSRASVPAEFQPYSLAVTLVICKTAHAGHAPHPKLQLVAKKKVAQQRRGRSWNTRSSLSTGESGAEQTPAHAIRTKETT